MLVLLAVPALASGPHAVEWSDVSFDDPVAGRVSTRVYRPAEAGPFPLAAFMHGWLGSAWMYDGICEELASHGFVVASIDTETGLVLDMADFADDAVATLHWVEQNYEVSDEPWTVLGHSMGGATVGRVLGLEPRIRTAVAFMPYSGYPEYYDDVSAWDGSLLVLSGTHDTTAPPALQREWMSAADLTARSLLVEITDMGHQAVTDLTFGEDPMPDEVQLALVSELATTFVRAEHGGDEALWADLLGVPAPGVERRLWSRSHDPVLWATAEGRVVSLGVAGLSESTAEVFVGAGSEDGLVDPISVATLDLPLGVAEATVDLPAELSGELWVSVRTDGEDGEVWTRAVPFTAPAAPSDGTVPPTPVPEDGPEAAAADGSGGGCSTVPGASFALWPWVLGLIARRRKA